MRFDKTLSVYNDKKEFIGIVSASVSDVGSEDFSIIFGDKKLEAIAVCTRKELPFRTGYLQVNSDEMVFKISKRIRPRKRYTYYAIEHTAGLER